ncbi:TOBE domain-containing protein [Endothiovibrio diazotrophicus]
MARKANSSPTKEIDGGFWLDKGGRAFLGRGRIELLEAIAVHGSISAAARAINMSYKAAWDAVDAMNNLSEVPLVTRTTGGRHGGGTLLTEHGHRTVELYRRIEAEYRQFLHSLAAGVQEFDDFHSMLRRFSLKTTARNQYRGRVTRLVTGAVNAEVEIDLAGGDRLTAIVSNESVECLGLKEGDEAYAMIKESSVLVTGEEETGVRYSARNRLQGVVEECREGAVNGVVRIRLDGGKVITAGITNESIRALGLREGAPAGVLVKATEIILATTE